MLRIASFNVNGIRAVDRRGFRRWLAEAGCDVVALQELRCGPRDLPEGVFGDYHLAADHGVLAGRNGVCVLTRHPPAAIRAWGREILAGQGPDIRHAAPDHGSTLSRELARHRDEGRYLEVDLAEAPVTVASLYLPKGGLPARLQKVGRVRGVPDGGAAYTRKQRFMTGFARYLDRTRLAARAKGREFLLLGDLNIAHTHLDVAAWRRNQMSDGFLPEEREWFGALLNPRTLRDVVRDLHPDEPGPYSWWSWLGTTYQRDAGWRIDHHLATPKLARTAGTVRVDKEIDGVRLSDHAAVVVDYACPVTRLGDEDAGHGDEGADRVGASTRPTETC